MRRSAFLGSDAVRERQQAGAGDDEHFGERVGRVGERFGKRYLGDLSESLANELIDFGKDKIPDMIERRNAARQLERYADDIAKRLRESLDARRKPHPELDADAVCGALSETLNGHISTHFLVAKDLDPRLIAM